MHRSCNDEITDDKSQQNFIELRQPFDVNEIH